MSVSVSGADMRNLVISVLDVLMIGNIGGSYIVDIFVVLQWSARQRTPPSCAGVFSTIPTQGGGLSINVVPTGGVENVDISLTGVYAENNTIGK
jgi:hypothetical protein